MRNLPIHGHVVEGSAFPVYEAASLSDQFPALLRKRAFRRFVNCSATDAMCYLRTLKSSQSNINNSTTEEKMENE
jgi:hypothetical protein